MLLVFSDSCNTRNRTRVQRVHFNPSLQQGATSSLSKPIGSRRGCCSALREPYNLNTINKPFITIPLVSSPYHCSTSPTTIPGGQNADSLSPQKTQLESCQQFYERSRRSFALTAASYRGHPQFEPLTCAVCSGQHAFARVSTDPVSVHMRPLKLGTSGQETSLATTTNFAGYLAGNGSR